jgi:hypothetical protein
MNRSWKKLIEDSKQRAAERMMLSTKEPQDHSEPISVDLPVSNYLAKIGRQGGKKGGPVIPKDYKGLKKAGRGKV